jgi:hypothetical protein
MTDPGELRMVESDKPRKNKVKKPAASDARRTREATRGD